MTEHSPRMDHPYPGREDDPWYDGFEDYVLSNDASGYAGREDRHLIISGGGTIAWNAGTGVLSWSAPIVILAAITGYQWQLAAGSVVINSSVGLIWATDIPRAPSENTAVTSAVGHTVGNDNTHLVLGVRIGTSIVLRSGVSITSGGSIPGFSPPPGGGTPLEIDDEGGVIDPQVGLINFTGDGVTASLTAPGQVEVNIPGAATDRFAPAVIVGNVGAGDTAAVCHYLDTGNGAQLRAAILAAGPNDDVYVRPGTYDFAAVGGPVAHIVIPSGVKVRGAGRGHVIVKTRGAGDQGAFDVGYQSELEDVTIRVTLPTGAPTGRSGIVELTDMHAEVRRVNVDFMDSWGAPEAANFDPIACFYVTSGSTQSKIIDCGAGLIGTMPSIWTLTGGLSNLYGIYTDGSPSSVGTDIMRFKSQGGDGGIAAVKMVRVRDAEISSPLIFGIKLISIEANGSDVTGCLIEMYAAVAGRHGIYLYQVDRCDVEGNYIRAWTGNASSYGIAVVESDENIIAKNRLPINWGIGINLDADSDDNIVSLNNMPFCLISDSGTGNELAHNITGALPID